VKFNGCPEVNGKASLRSGRIKYGVGTVSVTFYYFVGMLDISAHRIHSYGEETVCANPVESLFYEFMRL
jgi:hypothetical protein